MRALLAHFVILETRFEFRDFLKVFTLAILLYTVFAGILFNLYAEDLVFTSAHPSITFSIVYLIQFVVFFFPLWIFVIEKYGATSEDFGLVKVKLKTLLKTVGFSYLAYLGITALIQAILLALDFELPGYGAQESYLPLFGTDVFGITFALLVVGFLAPFIEEILFRGFIYRVFIKKWPLWMGTVLSAGLFALVHLQFQTFIPLFILGLILNHIYQKTGSIWTSIAFHSMNNLLAFAVQIYISYNGMTL
jgi:uncharacterized protein